MKKSKLEIINTTIFNRYLNILGVERTEPVWDKLAEITSAHLVTIPFENVSKIYQVYIQQNRKFSDLKEYLDTIENNQLGGTCFTNNYFLNLLLIHLGFQARICSANISVPGARPDSHMVNVVQIDGREVVVDVGYGAPFWHPFYCDSKSDVEQIFASDKYVLKPKDKDGNSKLDVYHKDQIVHGYLLKSQPKTLHDFKEVIEFSYSDKGTFLNRLVFVKFYQGTYVALRNNKLTETTQESSKVTTLHSRQEIINVLQMNFSINAEIACAVIDVLSDEILFPNQ